MDVQATKTPSPQSRNRNIVSKIAKYRRIPDVRDVRGTVSSINIVVCGARNRSDILRQPNSTALVRPDQIFAESSFWLGRRDVGSLNYSSFSGSREQVMRKKK